MTTTLTATPKITANNQGLFGRVRAPGDKSVSHRALIFGGLALGVTEITGLLEGQDILHTKAAVENLGAKVEHLGEGHWRVTGHGGFKTPTTVIDCGNAGTGVRLLMGAAAGCGIKATFDGDASLRSRPMGRVLEPLTQMGATYQAMEGGRLPLTLSGAALNGISYRLPMASAQVKSAILLAGLNANGETVIDEPEPSRDHTELMLKAFGANLTLTQNAAGERQIRLLPSKLSAVDVDVPGDPSSAAFPIVAALLVPGSDVVVENVMLNPLRIGLFTTLIEMGADISYENRRQAGGEEVADIRARFSKLKGIEVPPERAPAMIDEYPILAAAAAFAEGQTIMRGIGEMRVKESDRIKLMVDGLTACGVTIEDEPDGMIVTGSDQAPKGGALVHTHGDHRIAMSHLVLGLAAQSAVTVDEPAMIGTSFPTFRGLMASLGADIRD